VTRAALVTLLLVPALPTAAQDAEAALEAVRLCMATTPEEETRGACLGIYAQRCMAEEGGSSTAGMAACTDAETAAWDRLLNESYAALVIAAKRLALRAEEAGDPVPDHEGLLREAQRAWIAFRDADCAQEAAIWGEGSMARIAGAYCMLERAAARVFELQAKAAAMEPE
jgi:uncharacterized protein YecT (DUF1311 family)